MKAKGEKVIEVFLVDLSGEYATINIALLHVVYLQRVFEERLPPPNDPAKTFGGFLF